jgi:protein SCO1/2
MRRLVILLAAATIACGGQGDRVVSARGLYGIDLAPTVAKPPFQFTDSRGHPFRIDSATAGKVTLLFYGYTNCPDVCPVHLANIHAVLDKMPDDIQRQVAVIFVTTDPSRDSLAVLDAWVKGFDPSFIALTGSDSVIAAAQRVTRLPEAEKSRIDSSGKYTVGHASAVIAYTPDGVGRFAYGPTTRQREWAHDLPMLVAWGK